MSRDGIRACSERADLDPVNRVTSPPQCVISVATESPTDDLAQARSSPSKITFSTDFTHHNEKKIGGMLVDIAMIDHKVVVEVDGPHHYCRSDESSMRMLGNYRLKQRHLEAQGWRVVHVPFYEWDPLEPGQQRVYLTHKLELV